MKRLTATVLGLTAALTLAACSSGAQTLDRPPAASTTAAAATSATTEPTTSAATSSEPPTANPDGTFEGTCDYQLADSMSDAHAGDMLAEVDVTNTGNVGIIVSVSVTWPQMAHAPVKLTKKARLAVGQHTTLAFTHPATSSEIDLLQSWQEHHNYEDGCTYKGSVFDTFGAVQVS